MGINLNQLALDTAACVVEFQGYEANVTYRPNVLTPSRVMKMMEVAGEDDLGQIISFLVEIIDDWDVTRGKRKVPITEEGLKDVPFVFLKKVLFTIMEDMSAGEALPG